nr:molybdenum cofactor guanylyltransferase [Kofleriaceae bacterium]
MSVDVTADATAAALILGGGRATRLGGLDKLAIVVDGATILDRLRAVLAPRVGELVIAAPRDVPGVRCVRDAAGEGPLAGIAAGLAAVGAPWLIVVAGDMPYLTGALVDRVLAARAEDRDAVGVTHAGRPQPLVCALRVAAARPAVGRRLAAGRYKASGLLEDEGLRVAWLDEPDARTLRNINTPADLPG